MLYHQKMLAGVFSATLAGCALFVSVSAAAQEAHGVIAFGHIGKSPGVAYGFAWNFPAKDAAHAEAMNACISGGGTDCTQAAWFQNACGALAMDQHGTAQGKFAMTQEQAEARALQGCEAAGGASCNIVGSMCVTPDGEPRTYSGSESVIPLQTAQTTATEPAAESPAREGPAPFQDAQAAVSGPVDELPVSEDRALIQHALNALGFDAGPADGVFGPRTLAAIYYWQRTSGHETTGQLTRDQAVAVVAQASSLAEVEASPDQDEESPPIADADGIPEEQLEAAGNVLHFGPETGPKCAAGEASEDGHCWHELANKSGCFFLNRNYYYPDEPVSWSGACTDGGAGLVAVGQGTLETDRRTATGTMAYGHMEDHWVWRNSEGYVDEGPYVSGKKHGHWVSRHPNGTLYEEGPYVNDEKHGHWVERTYPDGRRVDEGPYVNGQEHGLWIIRYSDGTVLESHYVNGELQVN